jgi:protein-serine/threonine kinase
MSGAENNTAADEFNTTEVIFEHFRKAREQKQKQQQQQQQQPQQQDGDVDDDDASTSSTSTSTSTERDELYRMVRDVTNDESSDGTTTPATATTSASAPLPGNAIAAPKKPKKVFSRATVERATAAKFAIAQYYDVLDRMRIERLQRADALEAELRLAPIADDAREARRLALAKQETDFVRLRRVKLCESSFDKLKRVGGGAFGEVWLTQLRGSTQVFAMKKMAKSAVVQRGKAEYIRAERDALAAGSSVVPAAGASSPWVVRLFYSFQDRDYLYLVMEFVPGGDLMGLLMALDTFTEAQARFYIAEVLLAIEFVHSLHYIHRDVKPDNLLIDARGHLKISDFGLCSGLETMRRNALYERLRAESTELQQNDTLRIGRRHQHETWRQRRRLMCQSAVGTPDYIAPEVFRDAGYGQECDWWSVGIILYEMLYGHPPFCAEEPEETFRKIMNWRQTLQFPPDIDVSDDAKDLIAGLLCDREERLDLPAIKAHPFFASLNWDSLRQQESFFPPAPPVAHRHALL